MSNMRMLEDICVWAIPHRNIFIFKTQKYSLHKCVSMFERNSQHSAVMQTSILKFIHKNTNCEIFFILCLLVQEHTANDIFLHDSNKWGHCRYFELNYFNKPQITVV
jgi:hypothetical protein